MRELERQSDDTRPRLGALSGPTRIGVVGRGRVGRALASALAAAGYDVAGPAGRGEPPAGEAIVLCVPDREIEAAAQAVAGAAALVGHTSGATPLGALAPAQRAGAEAFALHPLVSVAGEGARFDGVGCAVAGSTPAALAFAEATARRLGMSPFTIDDEQCAAYHAAASIASNFLVTLEAAAETLLAETGLDAAQSRALLAPLVRSSVESWAALGPRRALTGPVARGDEATIALQREAIASSRPELVPLYDAMVERTRALAAQPAVAA